MVSLSFPFWESYWLKMSLEKKKKKRTGQDGRLYSIPILKTELV